MKPYGMDGESYMNFLLIVNNSIVKENVRKKRYVLSSKYGDRDFMRMSLN
jgi:hypothetical protein